MQIQTECHSDDRVIEVEFNAASWFAQAQDHEIKQLAECEWGGDYPADAVAQFMEGKDDGVTRLFSYLALRPRMPNGDDVGFECHVQEDSAMEWVRLNRPSLYASMCEDYYTCAIREEGEAAVNAAKSAGWHIDHDGWWVRSMRAGDPVIGEGMAFFGFTTEEDAPDARVYLRTAKYAASYDAGSIPAPG